MANLLKKTAVGLTNEGQPDSVCPKCHQPIAEGQMVNYPGGKETHVQCPPAQQQQPGQTPGWQSRLNLPPGFKQKQQQPQQISPNAGRPIASMRTEKKLAGQPPRFSFAVPMEAAGKVAYYLAKAGMRDFEVINFEEDAVSVFAFTKEPELHVAEEIIRAEFAPQIAAEKGMWASWTEHPKDPSRVEPTHEQVPQHMMSSDKTAEDPNSYLRGKRVTGPQAVPSRYEAAVQKALAGLDALSEIGPSEDIKGCAAMSAADLRQFVEDHAQGRARKFSAGEKIAGQWGERSYDGDTVHDLLDAHRPDKSQGFDSPVPEEEIEPLLRELDKGPVSGSDDNQHYLGVIYFLVTHGSTVPPVYRERARQIAEAMLSDEEYLNSWKNPKERAAELEKEIDILSGGKTAGIHPEADLPLITQGAPVQSKGMTDEEVAKMRKYRRKKLLAWIDELGLDLSEELKKFDEGDFWAADEAYESVRDMVNEDRKFQTQYRRSMRGR